MIPPLPWALVWLIFLWNKKIAGLVVSWNAMSYGWPTSKLSWMLVNSQHLSGWHATDATSTTWRKQIRRNGNRYHWNPRANKNSSKQKIIRSQQKKYPQQYPQMTFLGCTKNNWQQLSVASPQKITMATTPELKMEEVEMVEIGDVDWMEDVGCVSKISRKRGVFFINLEWCFFFKLKVYHFFLKCSWISNWPYTTWNLRFWTPQNGGFWFRWFSFSRMVFIFRFQLFIFQDCTWMCEVSKWLVKGLWPHKIIQNL